MKLEGILLSIMMMIFRQIMWKNYSDQLIGKLHVETAEAVNILPKDTSEEEAVLLGIDTVLVVIKEDTPAMFAETTPVQNIEVHMFFLLVN